MQTTHSIWEIIDEGMVFEPRSLKYSSHISNAMLFEISEDTEDGTYPRPQDYKRFARNLEDNGTSYWVNMLTRKRDKLSIEFYGATITRTADYEDTAVIEFKNPIKIVLGYIGDEPVVKEIKKIQGTFTHDWFWTKNGRQDEIANGFEIWFCVEKYLG